MTVRTLLGVAGIALLASSGTAAAQAKSSPDAVTRGGYLVGVMGCHDCHTPLKMGAQGPEPDITRALSGHPEGSVLPPVPKLPPGWMMTGAGTMTAFGGPWGVSYAANLTPDDTGLGKWTKEMFVSAVKTGKHAGVSRPILPPMPWQSLARLTDDDLSAVFAYLRSIKPVKNLVPPPLAPPPPATPAK
jgi:mono/diheme cytochrome c family protein